MHLCTTVCEILFPGSVNSLYVDVKLGRHNSNLFVANLHFNRLTFKAVKIYAFRS